MQQFEFMSYWNRITCGLEVWMRTSNTLQLVPCVLFKAPGCWLIARMAPLRHALCLIGAWCTIQARTSMVLKLHVSCVLPYSQFCPLVGVLCLASADSTAGPFYVPAAAPSAGCPLCPSRRPQSALAWHAVCVPLLALVFAVLQSTLVMCALSSVPIGTRMAGWAPAQVPLQCHGCGLSAWEFPAAGCIIRVEFDCGCD